MTGPGEPNEQNGSWQGPSNQGPIPPPHDLPQGSQPPRELPGAGGGDPTPPRGAAAFIPEPSAWISLLTAVPWFFWSLILVVWVAGAIGFGWGWIVIALWIASGAVTFLAPTEAALARYLFRLREPTLIEQQRLAPIWHQLLQRADVRSARYTLWIQESEDVNSTPTPGHLVAVTRWALYTLPPSHLESVLAHELGHHLGGRSWLNMLSFWYSIPARCGLIAVRAVARLMRRVPALGCLIGGFLGMAYIGLILAVFALGHGYIWPFLFVTPFIAPPFLAWLNRWHVKQADQKAAALGYGSMLVQVLYGWQVQHQQTLGRDESRRAQVMSSRPSLMERVRTLERTEGIPPKSWG
ncbi:M48 family metalloprotease [Kribbella sp. NPDC026611]|uniref:M48 family metalloprotease n=1 Tax=Kribbella sp. NPDC026611 TaxID=3154911 RepID=UPI0033FF894B